MEDAEFEEFMSTSGSVNSPAIITVIIKVEIFDGSYRIFILNISDLSVLYERFIKVLLYIRLNKKLIPIKLAKFLNDCVAKSIPISTHDKCWMILAYVYAARSSVNSKEKYWKIFARRKLLGL